MDPDTYQGLAQRTETDQARSLDMIREGGIPMVRLLHAAVGLTSDAGEVAAAVERYVFYHQDLDKTNLVEELGDCLWYIAQACNVLEVRLADVMAGNIEKLKQRYPRKFEERRADEEQRDRAAERAVLEAFSCPSCGTDERVCTREDTRSLKQICKGHFCPLCRNPVSDEVVRRLVLGERASAGCPQCHGSFGYDFEQRKLTHVPDR